MFTKFNQHLQEQEEGYFEHMINAWRLVLLLKKLEAKCIVHSIFPFCYEDAVSSKIECLQKMTKRGEKEQESDSDLYEVYGGD